MCLEVLSICVLISQRFSSILCCAGDTNTNGAGTSESIALGPSDPNSKGNEGADKSPNPSGDNGDTDNSASDHDNKQTPSSSDNNEGNTGDNLRVLGNVSLDYSRISEGVIVVLIGGVPFLVINLHWVLSHCSRNSRKTLSRWLQQKTLESSPWPLQSSSRPSGNTQTNDSSQQQETSTVASESGNHSKKLTSSKNAITISPAFNSFILKLLKACGLTSLNHSNSIFDSLRIWVTKSNPRLYTPSTDPNKKTVHLVNLDSVVEQSIKLLKKQRAVKGKSAGTAAQSNTSSSKSQ